MLPAILGTIGRVVAGRALQSGIASTVGRSALSSAQFARGAAAVEGIGGVSSTIGRSGLMASRVLGNSSSNTPTVNVEQKPQKQPSPYGIEFG